jgi:DNA polymerase-3 subunit chi
MKNNSPREISFYRLTTLPLAKAAPKLIEKIYYSKQNLVVVCENEAIMKTIDDGLWVYSSKHFIPHATSSDEHASDQPIYITTILENPNNANIAMSLGKLDLQDFSPHKFLYMFDGNIKDQLEFARNKWKSYKDKGHNLTYWQQNNDGAWEKKDT